MKNIKILFVFGLLLVLLMSCGSNRSAVKRSAQEEKDAKERYLYAQSDKIFEKYKRDNQDKVNGFTVDYIGNYKDIAIDKMVTYNIPASITLAQGILESGNGLSTLAKKSNNHFGIKCHSGWKGKKVYHDDDKRNECFRKYDSPEGSFNDHSLFLTSRGRYEFLFDLEPDDYKGWAKGLKKAGYATDRKYPKKLMAFIENFELYAYDELVLDEKGYKRAKKETAIASNDRSEEYIIVNKGDTLYSISRNNNVTVEDLKRLNDLNSNDISIGQKLIVSE
jgi:flagellum-specific peptidoglycan hydrolase FlgJ